MLNPLSISGPDFPRIDDDDSDYEDSITIHDYLGFPTYIRTFDHAAYHENLERTLIDVVLKEHRLATGLESDRLVEEGAHE